MRMCFPLLTCQTLMICHLFWSLLYFQLTALWILPMRSFELRAAMQWLGSTPSSSRLGLQWLGSPQAPLASGCSPFPASARPALDSSRGDVAPDAHTGAPLMEHVAHDEPSLDLQVLPLLLTSTTYRCPLLHQHLLVRSLHQQPTPAVSSPTTADVVLPSVSAPTALSSPPPPPAGPLLVGVLVFTSLKSELMAQLHGPLF
jgi:hypothetical protein